MGGVFQFSLWIEYCLLLPCLSQGVLSRGCHGSLSWVSTSRSGRLVALGSAELVSAQSFHSVCSLRHILAFVRCELGSPLVPSTVAALLGLCLAALPFCLITAGLASMDGPLLVSSAESHLCEWLSRGCTAPVSWLRGVSPASPNCPPSCVRKQRSFGFSASLSR